MGVPGFFRWICQRYPLVRRSFNDPSPPVVNNLYIEINGNIHFAAESSNLQGPELTEYFLSELYRTIDSNVQLIKPTDLIFISGDGIAPFAKAIEQRARRFVLGPDHVPNTIDHCTMTPGTEFMLKVHSHLIEFIEHKKKTDLLWSNARVIYSGVTVPGEGEHKIINYIREGRSSPEWKPNQVHCVTAGDADVLFLALQTHEPYFIFYRRKETFQSRNPQVFDARPIHDKWSANDFELIHVSLIREYLSIDFGVKGEDLELMIDDFVALSFLIGNDFIPHIKDIDIYETYNDILSIYKKMRKSSFNLIENNKFNKVFLKNFLLKIVEMLQLKYKKEMNLDLPIDKVAKLYTQNNRQYLAEKFDDETENLDELIKDMSNSLLDAFDWVLKYYREGCPSWKWFYPYHYAPPIEFVIPFIDDHEDSFEEDFPNQPLLQLLAILPPQAKDLLPKDLAVLMDSEELKSFYPYTFEKDLNGREKEWQATFLVPILDLDILEKKFNEVVLPEDVLERLNRIEFPIEYMNDGSYEEINLSKGESPFQPVLLATKRPFFIPTFENFDFKYEEKVVPVKVFWSYYKKPSIVIKVEREKKNVNNVKNLLNTTVLVNWPYFRPAKIVGIMDEKSILNNSSKSIIPIQNPANFPGKSIHDNLLTTQALYINANSVILTVCYQKMDGSFDMNKTFDVPLDLTAPLSFHPDILQGLNQEQKVREPDINEKVVLVNLLSTENCVGRIIEKKGEVFNVSIIHRAIFPTLINESNKWLTLDQIVRAIGGISFRGLRQCIKRIIVDPYGVNIAFTLLSIDRKVLFGCCKSTQNKGDYVVASFILPLLIDYFKYTGSLKKLVMDSISKGEKFLSKVTTEMLYGGSVQHQNECYAKLIEWLSKYAPSLKYPLVDEENDFLSAESLAILESRIDSFDLNEKEDSEIKAFNSSEVIWRMKHIQNHSNCLPKIGQRVVSVAASGPALFGEIGTVIETNPNTDSVFVLFDRNLMGLTKFEGILSTHRGMEMSINDIVAIG